MPFDGSGNFSRLYSWQSDRDNGIRILASKMDGEFDNFAAGMNVVFFRNGLVPMSGNLNMGQNYITGLGAGSVGALSMRFADDPNSGLYLNGYNKPTLVSNGVNRLEANTAGVNVNGNASISGTTNSVGNLSENGSRVWTAATFNPGSYMPIAGGQFTGPVQFANDANFGVSFGGSNPVITLDSGGDTFYYERAINRFGFNVGGNPVLQANAVGTSVTGTLSSTGAITQNGNQVWHAGNFTPGNYALLTGAIFTGSVRLDQASNALDNSSSTYALRIGQGSSDSFTLGNDGSSAFIQSWGGRTLRIQPQGNATTVGSTLNVSGALTQAGNQVWHAGNLANPASRNGATFTGGITAPTVGIDSNFVLSLGGPNPLFTVDSGGDQFYFERGVNRFGWDVASTNVMQLTSGGLTVVSAISVGGNITRSGGGAHAYQSASGLSAAMSRGTAAPSGGSDGDIYFQYV